MNWRIHHCRPECLPGKAMRDGNPCDGVGHPRKPGVRSILRGIRCGLSYDFNGSGEGDVTDPRVVNGPADAAIPAQMTDAEHRHAVLAAQQVDVAGVIGGVQFAIPIDAEVSPA